MQSPTVISLLLAILLLGVTPSCKPDNPPTPPADGQVDDIGTGGRGHVDGPANQAQFTYPYAVATDLAGNVYVTEPLISFPSVIRKISPSGDVTTLSGSFSSSTCFRDGPAATAAFCGTYGITTDLTGNIYVTDDDNYLIRKISTSNWVSTVAGDRSKVLFLHSLAIDRQGNIFVTSETRHCILKISPSGVISEFAGKEGFSGFKDGKGIDAQFHFPGGIAIDKEGYLYVADAGNDCIRKINPDGAVSTLAGTGIAGITDGEGKIAQFNSPTGITVDEQLNLYVADKDNNRIRKITKTGIVSTVLGDGRESILNGPTGIALDKNRNFYIVDHLNFRILKRWLK